MLDPSVSVILSGDVIAGHLITSAYILAVVQTFKSQLGKLAKQGTASIDGLDQDVCWPVKIAKRLCGLSFLGTSDFSILLQTHRFRSELDLQYDYGVFSF